MKRKHIGTLILCLVLSSLFYMYHTKKNPRLDYAPNSPAGDSVLHYQVNENSHIQEFENSGFIWKDSRGDEFPVYMTHSGSCFVIKVSKSGEYYRAYLGKDVSEQINRELQMKKDRGNDL